MTPEPKPDDNPSVPADGDLITFDRRDFYIARFANGIATHEKLPILRVFEGQDWRQRVKRLMVRKGHRPNVWLADQYGLYELLDLGA